MKRYRLFNLFVVLAILAGLLGAQPVFADGPVTAQLS